jgi:hypothetical protein
LPYGPAFSAPLCFRPMSDDTAPFGFQDIPAAEKAARVKGVFSAVASFLAGEGLCEARRVE